MFLGNRNCDFGILRHQIGEAGCDCGDEIGARHGPHSTGWRCLYRRIDVNARYREGLISGSDLLRLVERSAAQLHVTECRSRPANPLWEARTGSRSLRALHWSLRHKAAVAMPVTRRTFWVNDNCRFLDLATWKCLLQQNPKV